MRILPILLFAFAWAATLSAAGEVGAHAPDIEFARTWNMREGQSGLSSFRGSVVLIESLTTSSRYCAGRVPFLNQFQRQNDWRGFTVLGISDEDELSITTFSARYGAKYPIARVREFSRTPGYMNLPFACLVSASGSILWRGQPHALNANTIEAALDNGSAVTSAHGEGTGTAVYKKWIWVVVGFGTLFASSLVWFIWATRDRTPGYMASYHPQRRYGPQPLAPPPLTYSHPMQYPYGQPSPESSAGQAEEDAQGFSPNPDVAQQPVPSSEESIQYGGYDSLSSAPPSLRARKHTNMGADGAMESPGAAAKAEPPPLHQRPYLGKTPDGPPAPCPAGQSEKKRTRRRTRPTARQGCGSTPSSSPERPATP